MKDKDIILLFPPQWVPDHPYLSLPLLSSFLTEKGFSVSQADINLKCYDYFLSRAGLEFYLARIQEKLTEGTEKIIKKRKFYHTIGDAIIYNVESAKDNLRNGKNAFEAFTLLRTALELISSAYDSTIISFNSYEMKYSPYTVRDLHAGIHDSKNNMFSPIFSTDIVPYLLNEDPHLFALSIIHTSQLIPALTLAHELKTQGDDPFIAVGGPFFSAHADFWERLNPLFDYIDSIIFYDGETALASLISCIEKEGDFSTVPNLMYRDGTRLKRSRVSHTEDINALPPPSFAGFPLTEYLCPLVILPLETSRGCYWSRCTFCPNSTGQRHQYRSRNPDRVVEDMISLQTTYGARYFEFVDDAIPPQKLRHLSKRLISEDMGVRWGAEVRLEPQFTADLLTQMHKSGCRILYFGLESANPRILSLMDKGTDVSTAQKILYDSHEAGIWNHVYVFFGFPTETEAEAEDTISFIRNHAPIINSVGFGYFVLCEGSKIFEAPTHFNIKKILESKEELKPNRQYIIDKGIPQEKAKKIVMMFHEKTKKDFDSSFIHNFRWLSPLEKGYLH